MVFQLRNIPDVSESLAGNCRVADTGRSKCSAAANLRYGIGLPPDSLITPRRMLQTRPAVSAHRATCISAQKRPTMHRHPSE